jgi:apolipoprotein N-acyltransferase
MVEKRPPVSSMSRAVVNMLAVILIFAGIAAIGGLIAALAGGFEGWAIVAGIAIIALFAGGYLAVREGARRRSSESTQVVYAPDHTDELFDVDPNTGERTPHRD